MLSIFLKMKEQYIKTEMEYTFNFWMMILSGIVVRVVSMALPFVIYNNIPSIGGWTQTQIYLIMSFMFIADGLCSVLFEGIWKIPEMVFNGEFDTLLSRPISPLFQVVSYGVGLQGIGVSFLGIVSLFICIYASGRCNLATILFCLYSCFCGVILLMSLYLISNSFVFWYDSGGKTSIPYALGSVGEYARYPIDIYPQILQVILTYILPFACIGYIPTLMLIEGSYVVHFIFIGGVSALFFWIARTTFYRGIKNYESVGM